MFGTAALERLSRNQLTGSAYSEPCSSPSSLAHSRFPLLRSYQTNPLCPELRSKKRASMPSRVPEPFVPSLGFTVLGATCKFGVFRWPAKIPEQSSIPVENNYCYKEVEITLAPTRTLPKAKCPSSPCLTRKKSTQGIIYDNLLYKHTIAYYNILQYTRTYYYTTIY